MNAGLLLHLCSPGDVSPEDIVRWIGGSRHRNLIEVNADESGLLYRNGDTAVEAAFEFYDAADVVNRIPVGLRPTGIRFFLGWPRPSFFPAEAIPVLVELAGAKNLTLTLAQSENQPMKVVPAAADKIAALWDAGNVEAVRYEPPGTFPFMARERSERWWRYQMARDALHRRLGDEIFVPTMVGVVAHARTDDLLLHITWTDAIPLVIPECDLVTILDGTSPANFKIRGVTEYDQVCRALARYIEPLQVDGVGELHLLKPKQAKKARPTFNSLPVRDMALPQLEPAAWVDVS